MAITIFYAALLAIIFVILSLKTIGLRRSLHIDVGDGGNPKMLRAMRVHSNFAEYTPFALLLLTMVEAQGCHDYLIHALGITLLVGRLSHAFGVAQEKETFIFRVSGMIMTFTVILTSSFYLLVKFFRFL
jgi:uncharacterized membrane protein YecN with MAPEG domain